MPIDARIPLGVRGPQVNTNQLFNLAQMRFQRENATRRNELLEAQNVRETQRAEREQVRAEREQVRAERETTLFEEGEGQRKLAALGSRDQSRLRSLMTAAAQLSPLLESGNIEGARAFLTQRRPELQAAGLPTNDTDEMLGLLDTNPQLAQQQVAGALDIGTRLGLIEGATAATPPKTRSRTEGGETVFEEFDPRAGTFREVSRGPRFSTTPQSQVTIAPGEKAQEKAEGKRLVDEATATFEAADAAQGQLQNLMIARDIDVSTGALEPFKAKVSALAGGLGIDPENLGLESATNAQAFQGVMENLVLTKMQAQKGPQTENDAKRIQRTVASLGNTPEASDFLMDAAVALRERDIEKANFWTDWRAEKGTYEGARKAWSDRLRRLPLIASNPNTGRPVFYSQFRQLILQENPEATQAQIDNLWGSKYARTR